MNDARLWIPPLDASGLPAPAWVFVALLNATLVLHFIAMGYVVTASLLQVLLSAAARPGSSAEWMLCRTARPLPIALSQTITLGVAPLLFVQVLYQPLFYPANILLGHRWFGIVPALIAAFYLILWLPGGRLGGRPLSRPWLVVGRVVVFGLLIYVLFTLTTNALVMLRPDRWREMQASGAPWRSLGLLLAPRLIHNFLAALIVGAVWLMALGMRSMRVGADATARAGGRGLARLGALMGGGAIIVQMMIGVWLIVIEEPAVREMLFSPAPAAILWMSSLTFVMGLAILCMLGLVLEQARGLVWIAWGCLGAILTGMFAAREAARQVHVTAWFRMADWPVHTQPGGAVSFLVLLAAGLAIVALGLGWVLRARRA